ncbi:MAG: VanW family protein [bacterium]|nr:VanW family protein [bacterium]
MSSTQHHHVIWLSITGAVLVLLLAAVGVGAITYDRAYEGRIFPGVRIGTVDVSGLTQEEATERVRSVVDARLNQGIAYTLDGATVRLSAVVVAPSDPDLWYPLVEVNVPTLVEHALLVGRAGGTTRQWAQRLHGAVNGGLVVPIETTIYRDQLLAALGENYTSALSPMELPSVTSQVAPDGAVTWTVAPGRAGRELDADAAMAATQQRIALLDPAPVVLTVQETQPPYTTEALAAVLPELDTALARTPLTVTHDAARWTIDRAALAPWLAVDDTGRPTLNQDAVARWIGIAVAPTVERPARDAALTFHPTTKRVTAFTPSREGIGINRTLFAAELDAAIFGSHPPLIELPVERTAPKVALADTNSLGITELLGRGRTSFAGSPANRRHNIHNGSSLLNGLIIPPGEEFSTVAALSPFDGGNNYKPELVIKGNRTIPEFGGGLCQVSTTLFRTILNAGLPITARTNHAYRVSYYEPPIGMDATIYGPWPDFRFKNDTQHHLLIVTRVEGNEPIYEIWGTNDGRLATTSEPEMYNIVQPAETKIIETTDLPPGETKCIERAHAGADAKFTYTVTHADGRIDATEFKSHYRPWQAICLKGVDPATLPPPEPIAAQAPADSSTPTSIPALVE